MSKEIKKSTPMLWVEIAFWNEKEIIYFEGSEAEFRKKLQFDFVYFSNLNRNILRSKIKDFGLVKDETVLTREMKLSSLTELQKAKVKEFVQNMKRNIGREPTDTEFDSMILKAVSPEVIIEDSPLCPEKRRKTIEIIQKMRENKKRNWSYKI